MEEFSFISKALILSAFIGLKHVDWSPGSAKKKRTRCTYVDKYVPIHAITLRTKRRRQLFVPAGYQSSNIASWGPSSPSSHLPPSPLFYQYSEAIEFLPFRHSISGTPFRDAVLPSLAKVASSSFIRRFPSPSRPPPRFFFIREARLRHSLSLYHLTRASPSAPSSPGENNFFHRYPSSSIPLYVPDNGMFLSRSTRACWFDERQ